MSLLRTAVFILYHLDLPHCVPFTDSALFLLTFLFLLNFSLLPPRFARNMNSDNTSIGGFTLDLGPFSFMEAFDRNFQPFTSDRSGMYAFSNQPRAACTALEVFARAVTSTFDDRGRAKEISANVATTFKNSFAVHFSEMRRRKLGFSAWRSGEDDRLWFDLEDLMEATLRGVDWTVFWSRLTREGATLDAVQDAFYFLDAEGGTKIEELGNYAEWTAWMARYREAKEELAKK